MRQTRRFVRLLAVFGIAALVATACGSSGGKKQGSVEKVDTNGVMRIGALIPQTALFFDSTTQVAVPASWFPMIYDTLLRRTANGGSEPGLAKKATIVDSSTLTVELNTGIKFTDGTVLDATAVKYGIERNIAKGKAGSYEAELYQLDTITVDSPTTLTIKLKTPIAGAWYRLLSLGETSPVSPTADKTPGNDFNKKPVGAGPFMLESAQVDDHISLVKNPTYFQADKIKLAGITFVNVATDAIGNALRTKVIDISLVSYTVATSLKGTGVHTEIVPTDSQELMGHICKSRAPFADIRVRQAVNYAMDRDAMNAAMFDGQGEPMWGFFAKGSPFHDASLENYYKRDVAKAKSLLAAAGVPNLAFDMYFPAGTDGTRSAEIFQSQMKEAGISVTLKPAQADFFPEALGAPIQLFTLSRQGLNKVTRVYVPGSYGNVCTWDDPTLNALVKSLQAVQEDSPEGIKIWKQIQARGLDTAVTIFGLFGVQSNAWDDSKLADVDFLFVSTTAIPNFYKIYVKG
jgi:peptide/nickel transport system substrate-binding protein